MAGRGDRRGGACGGGTTGARHARLLSESRRPAQMADAVHRARDPRGRPRGRRRHRRAGRLRLRALRDAGRARPRLPQAGAHRRRAVLSPRADRRRRRGIHRRPRPAGPCRADSRRGTAQLPGGLSAMRGDGDAMSLLAPYYPWLKTLHILSVIAWMAGLLYLPRLFVYHAEARPGSDAAETFKVMERRLLRGIMNPALIGTYGFGEWLAATPGVVEWGEGWIYVKLAAVLGLTVIHHRLAAWRRDFAADRNARSARFYRFINEVPTLL